MIVNLGDKSKVVTYGSNGLTNCLDLCKCILKKYGLTNFGSPNNIFRLIYEDNGTIKYYGSNPQDSYRKAIECIDNHLDNGRPIIVGVNHTLGKTINEGATDHFVVIYGKGYEDGHYFYTYYEVGKSSIDASYNDKDNRFVYVDDENPLFYDIKSNRKDGKRFDVTQVRPNNNDLK